MKSILVLIAVAFGVFISSCSSEKKQEKMWDTSVAADSDFINLDTGSASGASIDTASSKTDTTKVN
ncbi:hypothetical protein [Pedobacter xixiisoli]|uniref:Uncharacterized protein n=1 Tax=Pedobacter xixiisoli TaxID=1476464 RepID=A0A285ZWX0_9SPHI|nr:hypothetical protein [Pedobacter xixiisoli]SOD14136.1 hypothetical protein SAMN06297358_1422 [Pedobacter xixiisoli]